MNHPHMPKMLELFEEMKEYYVLNFITFLEANTNLHASHYYQLYELFKKGLSVDVETKSLPEVKNLSSSTDITCQHIFKRGKNANKKCLVKVKDIDSFCSKHKKECANTDVDLDLLKIVSEDEAQSSEGDEDANSVVENDVLDLDIEDDYESDDLDDY
jgi:hypothetical protein